MEFQKGISWQVSPSQGNMNHAVPLTPVRHVRHHGTPRSSLLVFRILALILSFDCHERRKFRRAGHGHQLQTSNAMNGDSDLPVVGLRSQRCFVAAGQEGTQAKGNVGGLGQAGVGHPRDGDPLLLLLMQLLGIQAGRGAAGCHVCCGRAGARKEMRGVVCLVDRSALLRFTRE